jgi:hypothetical protein
VRNREKPLDERQPPVEITADLRVVHVEMNRLLVNGRRISIGEQCQVGSCVAGVRLLHLKVPRKNAQRVRTISCWGVAATHGRDDQPSPLRDATEVVRSLPLTRSERGTTNHQGRDFAGRAAAGSSTCHDHAMAACHTKSVIGSAFLAPCQFLLRCGQS